MKTRISPRRLCHFVLAFSALALVPEAYAQVGNDNPTGPAGIFNGNITTGCSYDPYTANAMRRVTDLVVAGAVGTNPLAFTRIYNSRSGQLMDFGQAAWWSYNYHWILADSNDIYTGGMQMPPPYSPASYTVYFPDGRWVTFQSATPNDGYLHAGPGIAERFQRLNTSTSLAYLLLADGSKVEFKGTENGFWDPDLREFDSWYSYVAQALIDPHGLRTTFTYNANGLLSKITEPAGRYITINYGSVGGMNVITSIQASDGRTVTYNYGQGAFSPGTHSYVYLSSVNYYSLATASYTYQAPNDANDANGVPLLSSCNDPMYDGPMKKISYIYQTTNNPDGSSAVYGQIKSENYPGGPAVSSLTVNNSTTRTETRADGKTRTLTYSNPYRLTWSDFKGVNATQTWDTNQYVNSVTNRNGNKTSFTRNAFIGVITQIQYPLTTGDTPGQTQNPTVNYTYGNSGCADANNRDPNNPYWVCTATDEGGHVTQFTRDTSHRVTRIDYPDSGYETFAYNSFGEVTSHRMTTGGTETFTYDASGNKLTYRNPSNASGNPTAQYQYESHGWVSGITDALGSSSGDPNHTTSFTYNTRGQVTVTTHPTDPVDGVRHTITNTYNNSDGTLQSTKDELNHTTSFAYDDYRRMRSMTTPTNHTTNYFYDANGSTDDYQYADSNVTWLVLPSGKKTKTVYDQNRRKLSVTASVGTSDAATTSYGYDAGGNLTTVTNPLSHVTTTAYDQRNRPSSITDALNNTTTFTYDTAGHKKSVTRPNGQSITYDSYDAMNRLLQQTATQTPEPNAVTKYTYTQAGLLATMQDPRLVALGSSYKYTYAYDTTGRKTSVTYPPDSGGTQRTETFTYDTAGRLATFKNRNGKVQTFTWDALNRMTGFSWNDGVTPSVTFGYDVASRLTNVNNVNATISCTYFNDNLLNTETESITGGSANTVTYTYDPDGNRATAVWPGNTTFTYNYTGRNQLQSLLDGNLPLANYGYDADGNLTSRSLFNGTSSTYSYDALDRVTSITHALNGDTRTFAYAYDSVGNRKWTKRDGGNGDVFGYDYADQATSVLLNVSNPDTTSPGPQTIVYDANGNRTTFSPYGSTDTYVTNNLNQYSSLDSLPITYDATGNLTSVNGSTATYDAQNRLTSASGSGTTETFAYDGLNRQVSRTINGVTTYNVWDGWDLIIEYQGSTATAAHVYGAGGGLITDLNQNCYYQDGSGSTSHLADSSGHLLEWYRYDLQGAPVFYNFANTQQPASSYGVRHLFTGQQWYSELGLYDLRNRFYSPQIGRFLQSDPIDFNGDPTNVYRYCWNNPLMYVDPFGLWTIQFGLSGTVHLGPFMANFGFGAAFDSQGNFGWYNTRLYGGGVGLETNVGFALYGSSADTIYGLQGPFTNVGGDVGLAGDVQVETFYGRDVTNGKAVNGYGAVFGLGEGGGVFAGRSTTNIWSPGGAASGPSSTSFTSFVFGGPDAYAIYGAVTYDANGANMPMTVVGYSVPELGIAWRGPASGPSSVPGTRGGPFASVYSNPVAVLGDWGGPMYGIGFGSGGFYGPSLGMFGASFACGMGPPGGGYPLVKYL
jgi:RHS repeat-associated protein